MKLRIGATTDSGRRPNNEDSHGVWNGDDLGIKVDAVLVVADGMGGRNFGEHASETAVEVIKKTLSSRLSEGEPEHAAINIAIEFALRQANASVYELSLRDSESQGMGTTCVVAVIARGRLHLGHVGDSRAYVIHHNAIEQLTDDHSFVAEQVRAGLITEETARTSKFRNVITRAVGIEPTIDPDVAEYPIDDVDALLLCSDGLSNMVADHNLERILLTSTTPQAAADKLVRMAKTAGGSDNITAVVARFSDGPIVQMAVDDAAMDSSHHGDGRHISDDDHVSRDSDDSYSQPRGSSIPMAILSVLLIVCFAAAIYFGSQLSQAGYTFQSSPPFVQKPLPPAPPSPPDLSNMTYGAPQQFYPYPVEPEPLLLSAEGKFVTAISDGALVRLSTVDGTTLSKIPLPNQPTRTATTSHGSGPLIPNPGGTGSTAPSRHFATDPQGNIYISDAHAKTIEKLRSSGELIKTISSGLRKPEAIAVDDNGNIYVVDATTLKLIAASPVHQ